MPFTKNVFHKVVRIGTNFASLQAPNNLVEKA
jgi:hypothetical protein